MATSKDCGTQPVSREGLIISRRKVLSRGKVSLRSLVGMGSKRQVVVGYGCDVRSHNHHDWQICLFTVRMFGKIDPNPKSKKFAFSQHDICILCENTRAQSTVQKIFLLCELFTHTKQTNTQKKTHPVSQGLQRCQRPYFVNFSQNQASCFPSFGPSAKLTGCFLVIHIQHMNM